MPLIKLLKFQRVIFHLTCQNQLALIGSTLSLMLRIEFKKTINTDSKGAWGLSV